MRKKEENRGREGEIKKRGKQKPDKERRIGRRKDTGGGGGEE